MLCKIPSFSALQFSHLQHEDVNLSSKRVMKGNDFLDWHVGHQGKWSLSVRGMREKEGICQEAESLRGAGGAGTKGLCEGEERVWALLGEKVSEVVVALGTKVEKGMRRTIGPALRLVGTDGGGQVVGCFPMDAVARTVITRDLLRCFEGHRPPQAGRFPYTRLSQTRPALLKALLGRRNEAFSRQKASNMPHISRFFSLY